MSQFTSIYHDLPSTDKETNISQDLMKNSGAQTDEHRMTGGSCIAEFGLTDV